MKIISITYYTILRNLRDIRSLLFMVFSQILIILILGTALGGTFKLSDIDKVKVAYLKNGSEISKSFDKFLSGSKSKETLAVLKVSTYEEGIKLIKEKRVTSFIVIDDKALSKEDDVIKVVSSEKGSFRASIVQNFVDSFLYEANLSEAIAKINGVNKSYKSSKNIEEVSILSKGKKPRAIDFYAVTMLIMMIMYGASYGSWEIGEDIFGDIGKRTRSTPIKPHQLFIGKTLGSIFTLYLEALVIIFFTKLVYKVNWGPNLGVILLITFLMCMLTTGFGIMVTMLCKDHYTANRMLSILTPLFTFLSGGFFTTHFNKTLEKATDFLPNKLAHTAIFNTIYPTHPDSMYKVKWSIIVIISLLIITFLISILSERRMSKWQSL